MLKMKRRCSLSWLSVFICFVLTFCFSASGKKALARESAVRLHIKGPRPRPLHGEPDLQLGEVMDERRAGKRLIILITGRIKINAPPCEGEAVVPADHCSYCIGVDFVGIAGGGRRRGRADHI